MKILHVCILIFFSWSSHSQDLRLFEHPWYLHNLIMDGQSNVPPINNELPFVPAEFIESDNLFTTKTCTGTDGSSELIYVGTTEFTVLGFVWFLQECTISQNIQFTQLYLYQFWDNPSINPVEYEILENGAERTLILTASNGNQAIYGNNFLSNQIPINDKSVIYPSPVKDVLFINIDKDINNYKIKVYDVNGKKLMEKENVIKINLKQLTSGTYFLLIENQENIIVIKKIIKN